MYRRLGQQGYCAESPIIGSKGTVSLPVQTDSNVKSRMDDLSETGSSEFDSLSSEATKTHKETIKERRIVNQPEIAMLIASICGKLGTIVNLVHEFSVDALGLRESADDLLEEMQSKIRPYLIILDIDMLSAEAILRYNIDRTNVYESRINWLLTYTKYQKEMRRVLNELASGVCDDLEDSLELRRREKCVKASAIV